MGILVWHMATFCFLGSSWFSELRCANRREVKAAAHLFFISIRTAPAPRLMWKLRPLAPSLDMNSKGQMHPGRFHPPAMELHCSYLAYQLLVAPGIGHDPTDINALTAHCSDPGPYITSTLFSSRVGPHQPQFLSLVLSAVSRATRAPACPMTRPSSRDKPARRSRATRRYLHTKHATGTADVGKEGKSTKGSLAP